MANWLIQRTDWQTDCGESAYGKPVNGEMLYFIKYFILVKAFFANKRKNLQFCYQMHQNQKKINATCISFSLRKQFYACCQEKN